MHFNCLRYTFFCYINFEKCSLSQCNETFINLNYTHRKSLISIKESIFFFAFKVKKRPSIEAILVDPIVLRRNRKMDRLERRNSAGSAGADSLYSWEDELKKREKKLEMKEKELKSISLINF